MATIAKGSGKPAPFFSRKFEWPKALRGDRLTAILVLMPSIIAVAIFVYGFILWTFRISFVKWDNWIPDYTFVGLSNWINLFTNDERFAIDIRNLIQFAATFMTQCIVMGFLLASLLNQNIKGESVFRTIFIFPFAVSGIVTGVAWKWLMYPSAGINMLFQTVGLGFLSNKWYRERVNTQPLHGPLHLLPD